MRRRRKINWKQIRRANRNRPRSDLEIQVAAWLDELKIPYKEQHAIGKCHCDFFIKPNIALEVNGCWYHICLACYPSPTRRMKARGLKDFYRYRAFESRGYQVVTIKGCEIKKEPDKVIAILKEIGELSCSQDSAKQQTT